jgi:hypothetical protein
VSSLGNLSLAEQAFLLAIRAWGEGEEPAILLRLGHQQARKLNEQRTRDPAPDPLASLHFIHDAQISPEPSRIHATWFVRALREESLAVQRVVVAEAVEPLRSTLLRDLQLTEDDLRDDRPAIREAVEIARSIWTERLVGDAPQRDDDPPLISIISSFKWVSLYRFARIIGLAKISSLPIEERDTILLNLTNRKRSEKLHESLDELSDPRLKKIALLDWQATQPLGRHALAALGLITVGRIMNQADPYRLRWALQHLPYSIAKRLRSIASKPQAQVKAVIDWEASIFAVGCHYSTTGQIGTIRRKMKRTSDHE